MGRDRMGGPAHPPKREIRPSHSLSGGGSSLAPLHRPRCDSGPFHLAVRVASSSAWAGVVLLHYFLDDVQQYSRVEWLDDPARCPCGLALRFQLLAMLGGEHQDRNEARVRHRAEQLDELEAASSRHVDVADDEIEPGL